MKEIFPMVIENKMFVGVGNTSIEYIIGNCILNPESPVERNLWKRVAKVTVIDEFELVCNFLLTSEIEKAKEIAYGIKEYLTNSDAEYPKCIALFKEKIENFNKEIK